MDIKPYSASEYSDNEFVNILHDAALPHSDSPYSLYGSRIPPLKHGLNPANVSKLAFENCATYMLWPAWKPPLHS